MAKVNPKDMEIEIIPYDGTANPRNPFDKLTPEERHKKIVEIYAQIYLKMAAKDRKKKQFQRTGRQDGMET